jgi:hypothetical protein
LIMCCDRRKGLWLSSVIVKCQLSSSQHWVDTQGVATQVAAMKQNLSTGMSLYMHASYVEKTGNIMQNSLLGYRVRIPNIPNFYWYITLQSSLWVQ